jgi:hypothetical protein
MPIFPLVDPDSNLPEGYFPDNALYHSKITGASVPIKVKRAFTTSCMYGKRHIVIESEMGNRYLPEELEFLIIKTP